jgi:hypothetical protein
MLGIEISYSLPALGFQSGQKFRTANVPNSPNTSAKGSASSAWLVAPGGHGTRIDEEASVSRAASETPLAFCLLGGAVILDS